MQIVSLGGDNLHENVKFYFLGKKKNKQENISKCRLLKFFTQTAKR